VVVEVAVLGGGVPVAAVSRGAAGVMPVLVLGVVEAELHAVGFGGVGEFGDGVAVEGRRIINVVGRDVGMEHREAVVVFGGDDPVLHAGVLGGFDEFVGVEFHRVELFRVFGVFGDGDFGVVHDPFADVLDLLSFIDAGGDGVDAPVDEHAEAGFAPPLHAFV